MGFWEADQPDPPNYAEATREGILTDIETLPLRRSIEQAAKFGVKIEYKDPSTGEMKTADFSGMGDVDMSRKLLEFGVESSDKLAAAQLEQSQKYGLDYITQRRKELEAADPEGFAIREKLGTSVLDDLMAGKTLDAATRGEVIETERAGQAARGNILGSSSAAAEGMEVGNAGYRLWQQKLANAASFLGGTTPTAQFSGLAGAQAGASPFNPQSMASGTTINPQAGAQGWQAATQRWQMQFAQNAYAGANNPWANLFDTSSSMLTSASGTMIGNKIG